MPCLKRSLEVPLCKRIKHHPQSALHLLHSVKTLNLHLRLYIREQREDTVSQIWWKAGVGSDSCVVADVNKSHRCQSYSQVTSCFLVSPVSLLLCFLCSPRLSCLREFVSVRPVSVGILALSACLQSIYLSTQQCINSGLALTQQPVVVPASLSFFFFFKCPRITIYLSACHAWAPH